MQTCKCIQQAEQTQKLVQNAMVIVRLQVLLFQKVLLITLIAFVTNQTLDTHIQHSNLQSLTYCQSLKPEASLSRCVFLCVSRESFIEQKKCVWWASIKIK